MTAELTTLRKMQHADRDPLAVYVLGLAKGSQRGQYEALKLMADILGQDLRAVDWASMRYQHLAAVRSRLGSYISTRTGKPLSASYQNKVLSAIRGVMKQAWKLGLMTSEDYSRAVDLGRVEGENVSPGRDLSAGEIAALISVCVKDGSPAGVRDAAMIGLLYAAGLRRAEIVALDVSDFDTSGKLLIQGKRNRQRTAYINNGALDALTDWLDIRGKSDGPLFVAINRGGSLGKARLSTQTVYDFLVKRGSQAGVEDFSPHDFRRSFVSDLLDKGADIATVSKMAGHASVVTTARYDRRTEETKQRAAKLLHIPYKKRAR